MRVAYLGPTGTYNEEALRAAAAGRAVEARPTATIFDAVSAVERGEVERAFVPFENSLEGSVRSTLDTLAFDAHGVRIVGEYDLPIRHNLIARGELELGAIEVVLSHQQANAQCARFIREELPDAEVRAAESTADAVRRVASLRAPWAALGSAAAAEAYGCVVLREGVEDASDNVTRFVWLALESEVAADGGGPGWRTTLVFHELGDDRPGALVDALTELAERGVNVTRIESRPLRRGLGRYLFFLDLEGGLAEETVREAVDGLRSKAESVRILGSYPVGDPPPL